MDFQDTLRKKIQARYPRFFESKNTQTLKGVQHLSCLKEKYNFFYISTDFHEKLREICALRPYFFVETRRNLMGYGSYSWKKITRSLRVIIIRNE